MQPIITIKHGNEKLVSQSGLVPVGVLLEYMQLAKRLETIPGVHCVEPAISHGEILSSMTGLICMGKSDYRPLKFLEKMNGSLPGTWHFSLSFSIDIASTYRFDRGIS